MHQIKQGKIARGQTLDGLTSSINVLNFQLVTTARKIVYELNETIGQPRENELPKSLQCVLTLLYTEIIDSLSY